jgi:hypothetical protein
MSYRVFARRNGQSHTVVYNAFHLRRPGWETLAAIVGVLRVDPVHFRALWRKATHDARSPDWKGNMSDGAGQVTPTH